MTESEIYQYFQDLTVKRKRLLKMKEKISLFHTRCNAAVSLLNCGNGSTHKSVNSVENSLVRLLNATMDYENELEKYDNEKKNFFKFISVIHDEELEAILICRYILGASAAEIAGAMYIHRNSVYSRTERAVRILAKKARNIPNSGKNS